MVALAWLWVAVSGIALIFLLFRQEVLTPRKNKKLPPGPKGLPIIGHFHMLGKNPHQDLYRMAKKYGPIMYMRLGYVPTIIVSSPEAAEKFLKTHDLVFASRPHHEASRYISYDQRNLTFSPYDTYWRNMRKLCTLELLSSQKISQFQPMRRAEVNILVNSLRKAANAQDVVDVSASLASLTTDMTCLMVFGKKFLDKDIDARGFKAVIKEAITVASIPNLGDYFPCLGILDLQGLKRKMKLLKKIFDGFFEKIIDDHLQNKKVKQTKDFVDTLMGIMESGEAGFEFDRQHVKAILLDMLVAGTDSSSAMVEWVLSELIRHPDVMKKLQKEIEASVGLGRMVDESDLDDLEYLEMVVKETFRLHPVGPLLLPHESTKDCVIDGFYIPKKSRVMVNVWAIGRDPNLWNEPEKFCPERFIGSNIDVRGRDFKLIPFGSGRRGCPGLQLGLTVVRLVVAQLVHCFDWELPGGMKHNELDMTECFSIVTTRSTHLMAIPTYRLNN